MNIEAYLSSLSDAELDAVLDGAKADLERAASDVPNSEWHNACFAAVAMYAMERTKRKERK